MSELQAKLRQIQADIAQSESDLLDLAQQNEINRQLDSFESDKASDKIPPELLERLSELRSGYENVQSLIANDSIDAALEQLDLLRANLDEFGQYYPQALLVVDVSRKIETLANQINGKATEQWSECFKSTKNSLLLESVRLSDLAVKLGSAELFSEFDKLVIRPLLALGVDFKVDGSRLTWEKHRGLNSLDQLAGNLTSVAEFVASAPEPLSTLIPRRFGTRFVNTLIRTTIPMLYPDTSDPSDFQKTLTELAPVMDTRLSAWSQSGEFTRLSENFSKNWPVVREEHFLMLLRKIYQDPITEEYRLRIVDWYDEPDIEEKPPKDEWEWDDDEEDDETSKPVEKSGGALVSLWERYMREIDSPVLFYTLYRALVPVAYAQHDFWIYEDTCKFLSHIRALAPSQTHALADTEPLVRLCDDHLNRFVKTELGKLETSLCPMLFHSAKSQEANTKILKEVDSLALSLNSVGGPELRYRVLSLIVERIAVYVITAIEQMNDIGTTESQALAILISKLNPLGVYFDQVAEAVPSWTKLETLKVLLTSNLATIEELLAQHQLLDFSADELTRLLGALFQDSSERKRLITKFYTVLQ